MNSTSIANTTSTPERVRLAPRGTPPPTTADDPCFVVKDSAIHGRGAFAKAVLPAGTLVAEYVGEPIPKSESLRRCQANNEYIFSLNDQFDLDGSVEWNPARFLNHSCAPNCEAVLEEGRICIMTLRDIRAEEELTFNYGYDLVDYREHPCHCGSEECVGFMVAEAFFSTLRQQRRTPEAPM